MPDIRTVLLAASASVLVLGACAAAPVATESPTPTAAVTPSPAPVVTPPAEPTPEPTPTPAETATLAPSPTEAATMPPETEAPGDEVSLSISSAPGTTLDFVPDEAEVPTGADVRLRFRNGSAVAHNLTFGMPIEAATDPVVEPGQSETVTFTAPEPGDYPFVCTIHIGMSGTLRVTD